MNTKEINHHISKIALEKNTSSFNIIFDYFAPKINTYFIKTGYNQIISEELTQEVLITIWNKASQFNPDKASAKTWIFTIARNKRIDRHRKEKNPNYNEVDLIAALYEKEDNIINTIQNDQFAQIIMKNLNKQEEKLINMNFFEGNSHKKISKDLEIPLGTVKSKIRAILKKIRNNIDTLNE